MKVIQRIQAILQAADSSLADLASECVHSHDFDGATTCIETARKLASLLSSTTEEVPHQTVLTAANTLATPDAAASNRQAVPPAAAQTTRRLAGLRKGHYPKFFRDGDNLIKIGWSKSGKAEYEHKSPRKVLSRLIPAIAKSGASGRKFSMDEVLPLKDEDGDEVPGYQAYLCLAWLRTTGLVQQHGRQGYTIPKKADIAAAVESAWEKLPRR